MPVPVSSLSVAVQGIADFLDSQFGEEVNITVTNPQKASEVSKGAGTTAHCLNLFAYRVAPSGFHADAGFDETHFMRIHALLTAFPTDSADDDMDLRILGHAIRVLQSHPLLPIGAAPLPGPSIPAPKKDYRLEAIMLAPPMEEINHIWTTQGGDLAYRLSAVYEFALIPIEPISPRVEANPPETVIIDTHPTLEGKTESFFEIGNQSVAQPNQLAPPVNWVPLQMGVDGSDLSNSLNITLVTNNITVAVVGPVDEHASFTVQWTHDDDTQTTQAAQIKLIMVSNFDSPLAQTSLTLAVPANATQGVILVQPATSTAAYPDSAFGNTVQLLLT